MAAYKIVLLSLLSFLVSAFHFAQINPVLQEIKSLEEQGRFDQAASLYRLLIAQDPQNLGYYLNLGLLYSQRDRYREAIEVYQKGLEKVPDAYQLRQALGFAYLFSLEPGDYRQLELAKREFFIAFRYDPKNAETLAGIGRVLFLEGKHQEAEQLYHRALEISPSNEMIRLFYLELRKRDEKRQG